LLFDRPRGLLTPVYEAVFARGLLTPLSHWGLFALNICTAPPRALWPANAPFGDSGVGGLPLASPPNKLIGGVYVSNLTDRDLVALPPPQPPQPQQIIAGSLSAGAVGTALLGPSPDGTCRAVFVVVTADGAIVQEHTLKGLDGLAPAGTVRPLIGHSWDPPNQDVEPRFGVTMNPYTGVLVDPSTQLPVLRQLFVSEPFSNTIAVINLVLFGPSGPPTGQPKSNGVKVSYVMPLGHAAALPLGSNEQRFPYR
jgi:hypothetical protein